MGGPVSETGSHGTWGGQRNAIEEDESEEYREDDTEEGGGMDPGGRNEDDDGKEIEEENADEYNEDAVMGEVRRQEGDNFARKYHGKKVKDGMKEGGRDGLMNRIKRVRSDCVSNSTQGGKLAVPNSWIMSGAVNTDGSIRRNSLPSNSPFSSHTQTQSCSLEDRENIRNQSSSPYHPTHPSSSSSFSSSSASPSSSSSLSYEQQQHMSLQQLHAHAHHAQGTLSQFFTPMSNIASCQTIPHPNTQSPAVPLSPCSSIDSQRMKTMSGKVKILFCLLIFHVPRDA